MAAETLQDLANEAMAIQDACNLSGLVQGWARSVVTLRRLLEAAGVHDTDKINQHPINKMWADKLADLARARSPLVVGVAQERCERLAKGEPCDAMGRVPMPEDGSKDGDTKPN